MFGTDRCMCIWLHGFGYAPEHASGTLYVYYSGLSLSTEHPLEMTLL